MSNWRHWQNTFNAQFLMRICKSIATRETENRQLVRLGFSVRNSSADELRELPQVSQIIISLDKQILSWIRYSFESYATPHSWVLVCIFADISIPKRTRSVCRVDKHFNCNSCFQWICDLKLVQSLCLSI